LDLIIGSGNNSLHTVLNFTYLKLQHFVLRTSNIPLQARLESAANQLHSLSM